MTQKSVVLAMMFTMLILSTLCRAQDQQPGLESVIESARAGVEADRNAIIAAAMNFNDKDAAAFWPIYREYEYQRSKLVDGRVSVIKEYVQKYPTLTDAEAKAMAERMFDYEVRLPELKKAYYKKFNKVLPALTVAKFFQLEHRIDLVVDTRVESSLPPLTQPSRAEQEK